MRRWLLSLELSGDQLDRLGFSSWSGFDWSLTGQVGVFRGIGAFGIAQRSWEAGDAKHLERSLDHIWSYWINFNSLHLALKQSKASIDAARNRLWLRSKDYANQLIWRMSTRRSMRCMALTNWSLRDSSSWRDQSNLLLFLAMEALLLCAREQPVSSKQASSFLQCAQRAHKLIKSPDSSCTQVECLEGSVRYGLRGKRRLLGRHQGD